MVVDPAGVSREDYVTPSYNPYRFRGIREVFFPRSGWI